MRLFKYAGALSALLLSTALFAIGPKPVGSGETADLPATLHLRNTGGSDGAGLCVDTSVYHAALFQNIPELYGFRKWCESRPGGSYPEKLDAYLKQYCAAKGVPLPQFIQHTGGDEAFLVATLKTSRIVCITYAGQDDFYRGETIAHMVNLVYLNKETNQAAILDNNRPGEMVWMTYDQLVNRWKGLSDSGGYLTIGRQRVGGSWAVAFLAPPPTPKVKGAAEDLAVAKGCKCASGCSCGLDPCYCVKEGDRIQFGQNCANGQCNRIPLDLSKDGWENTVTPGTWNLWDKGVFKGTYDSAGWHEAYGSAILVQTSELPAGVSHPGHLGGVDHTKVAQEHKYHLNGNEVSRRVAFAALVDSPADDTNRWHLAAVGNAEFLKAIKAKVESLEPSVRLKLHVQYYDLAAWPVSQNPLPLGISLYAPTTSRFSTRIGSLTDDVLKLLSLPGGPLYVEPAPVVPNDPPPPPVGPKDNSWALWLLIAGAGIVWILKSLKKGK